MNPSIKSLHDYQKKAIEWIIDKPHCGLFLEMGLGKTVICLKAIEKLRLRTLVVAPKRVAEQVWSEEADKWNSSLRLSVVKGNPEERRKAIKKEADVYVIGVNNITRDLIKLRYDVVIIDELSLYKNSRTVRYRTLRFLTKNRARIIGLTGTLAPNSYMDIWSQIFLLDRGNRLGRTKAIFKTTYFDILFDYAIGVHAYRIKPLAEKQIQFKLSDLCLSMQAKDYLVLPSFIENLQKVRLKDKLMKIYRKLVLEGVIILKDKVEIAENAMDLAIKCAQFASGFIYNQDRKGWHIHGEKIDKLKEIIACSTGNILIAYQFKEDVKRIKKEFYKVRELKTESDFKQWNEGSIPIALLHPKSGGYGLNLQAGGNTIIWYSPTYSLADRWQFNARLYRKGQMKAVIVHTIVCIDTIEEKIMKILERKDAKLNILLEALKLDKKNKFSL